MALNPENWRQINDLFDRALSENNTHFLSSENENVAREVRSLLAAHNLAQSFLQTPAGETLSRPRELQSGETLGDFSILRKLGAGSIATVYLADQISLGRKVALKVSPNIGEEGRNMAPLEHDHIVRIFAEVIEPKNNIRWTCMQYVPGLSLDQLLARLAAVSPVERSGRSILDLLDQSNSESMILDPSLLRDRESLSDLNYLDACLWITSRIAQALDYAHRRGVLHLDVKPANILINPYGRPMLMDFNVSQRGEGSQMVRGGTLMYMSPEQSRGFTDESVRVDGRADIYSLGKVMKEMVALEPHSSPEVIQCIDLCLEENPVKRLNASELVTHLESLLERRAIERQLPTPGTLTNWARMHPRRAIAFAIFAPQFVGSFINITYNAARVVRLLSPLQQAAFQEFVAIYNLTLYPVCLFIVWKRMREIFRPAVEASLEKRRKNFLVLPDRIIVLCLLGWMPGSILFPAWIHWRTGTLSAAVYGHFFISFTLSCLIAMTYSFLYTYFIVVRVFYMNLWTGTRDVRRTAREELQHLPTLLRFFYAMAGTVPLAGVALILWTGLSPNIEFRVLVTALLGMGIVGLLSGLRSSGLFSQTLFALTGIRTRV